MKNIEIKNRRELFNYFENYILQSYENLEEDQELEYGQNLLKTYMIETNIDIKKFKKNYKLNNFQTISNDLAEFSVGDRDIRFYLDYNHNRFWYFFSMEKSNLANMEIDKFMSVVNGGVDYPWLPIDLQRKLTKLGYFRGLGTKYKPREVFPEKYIEDNLEFGDLSIRSWGRGSENLYKILEKNDETKKFLSLSSIGIKRTADDFFILEDIGYNGNFTTRGGNSIHLHLDTLDFVRNQYFNLLHNIEENHRISYESKKHRLGISGEPIVINLENRIKNLEKFISYIISSKKPFRLWGLKTKLEKDYYKVKGLDLHNGDKYTLEITPEWIRMYLLDGACGNTALRLFVNIQRYYDSSANIIM